VLGVGKEIEIRIAEGAMEDEIETEEGTKTRVLVTTSSTDRETS